MAAPFPPARPHALRPLRTPPEGSGVAGSGRTPGGRHGRGRQRPRGAGGDHGPVVCERRVLGDVRHAGDRPVVHRPGRGAVAVGDAVRRGRWCELDRRRSGRRRRPAHRGPGGQPGRGDDRRRRRSRPGRGEGHGQRPRRLGRRQRRRWGGIRRRGRWRHRCEGRGSTRVCADRGRRRRRWCG